MAFYRSLLLIVLLEGLLWGAVPRQEIINGDAAFYQKMLTKLEQYQNKSDEADLQKTLLTRLLQLSRPATPESKAVTLPQNTEEYRDLFARLLKRITQKSKAQSDFLTNENRAQTVYTQIEDNNVSTLTEELFYTLYNKKKKRAAKRVKTLEAQIKEIEEKLTAALPHITFDEAQIDKAQKAFDIEIEALQSQIKKRHIESERYKLLDQKKEAEALDTKIKALKESIMQLYHRELEILFLRFSGELQKKNDRLFTIHQQMLTIIDEKLHGTDSLEKELDHFLKSMEKKQLGTMAAIKGIDAQNIKHDIEALWSMANEPLFKINKRPISIAKLLFALLIFSIGLLLGGLFRNNMKRLSLKNRTLTSSTRTLIANMGYYLIIIITFFVVMKALGINLTSLALVAGALSVGIGFGLQNVISNFVSGIILMVERSIKIGDYIQLDDKLRGHVVDIKMRSITINTNANIDIIVPNQDLIQNRVVNWTMNDKIRRFEIPFGVAYGTDPQKVIDVVEDAVRKSGFKDLHIEPERRTQVIMTGMGNSSVDFKLFVWIRGVTIFYPQRTASRFLIVIYNALYEAGIEIPFPQQDLHIRSIDTELPVVVRHEEQQT